jgi:hypothetical protein
VPLPPSLGKEGDPESLILIYLSFSVSGRE